LELARILRVEGEYEVLLTRSDDTFVPLVDRSLFANQNKADLFISIHCNASVSKSQSGFEVYYLAENASDPHAEATEALENSVVALEGPKSAQKQRVQELLFSMAQNEFINESSLLCNAVAKSVRRRAGVPDRGVKQANFHVLHGAQMPAILIETAFITHPPEESKLRQRKFRSAVVDAVLSAVQDYEKKLQVLYGKKD
jgi:N-acetylmuramoyl-L-alanine amidase